MMTSHNGDNTLHRVNDAVAGKGLKSKGRGVRYGSELSALKRFKQEVFWILTQCKFHTLAAHVAKGLITDQNEVQFNC